LLKGNKGTTGLSRTPLFRATIATKVSKQSALIKSCHLKKKLLRCGGVVRAVAASPSQPNAAEKKGLSPLEQGGSLKGEKALGKDAAKATIASMSASESLASIGMEWNDSGRCWTLGLFSIQK